MNLSLNQRKRYFLAIPLLTLPLLLMLYWLCLEWGLLRKILELSLSIRGQDPQGHYVYLRSLFFDHDLNFKNESAAFHFDLALPFEKMALSYYPIGPAMAWFPFWIFGHFSAKALNALGASYALTGYSFPYQVSISLAEKVIGLVGLFFSYRLAKIFVHPQKAFFAVIVVGFSSPFLFYMAFFGGMSHVVSMASVSVFLFFFFSTINDRTRGKWALLGLLGGAIFLAKWQNALYIFLPMVQSLMDYTEYWKRKSIGETKELFVNNIIFSVAFLLTISPQVLVWKIVFGSFLIPGTGQVMPTSPHLLELMFSLRHGIFTWHPILLLATVGLFCRFGKDRKAVLFLLLGLCLQIYYCSTVSDWWSSDSFGQRRMVNATPVFICGLAFLSEALEGKVSQRVMWACGLAFIAWNLLFIYQFFATIMPDSRAISIDELIFYKFRLLGSLVGLS